MKSNKNNFKQKVLGVVRKILMGQVMTYKRVAELAGSPRAHQAVGNVLKQNYNSEIPCLRVTKSNGQPGSYNCGLENKIKLLKKENSPAVADGDC